jgi:hypothetical protein
VQRESTQFGVSGNTNKAKGKGFPLQASSGSWGSRRLRLLDLLDFRHYEDGKVRNTKRKYKI